MWVKEGVKAGLNEVLEQEPLLESERDDGVTRSVDKVFVLEGRCLLAEGKEQG